MQKIAFTIFEVAKQAVIRKIPQDQLLQAVEHHVIKVYKQSIEELQQKGIIDEDIKNRAESQSNIDEMAAQAQAEQQRQKQEMMEQSVKNAEEAQKRREEKQAKRKGTRGGKTGCCSGSCCGRRNNPQTDETHVSCSCLEGSISGQSYNNP